MLAWVLTRLSRYDCNPGVCVRTNTRVGVRCVVCLRFSTVGKCQAFVPEVKDPQLDYPLLAASLMDFDTKYCSFDEPENRDPRRPNQRPLTTDH